MPLTTTAKQVTGKLQSALYSIFETDFVSLVTPAFYLSLETLGSGASLG
jgi:hypothetical protein